MLLWFIGQSQTKGIGYPIHNIVSLSGNYSMATPKPALPPNWKSCFREDLFKNKVALVTGGGTGIGRSITTELALLGATVVIASRNVEKCQKAADEINTLLKKSSSAGRVVVGPSTNIRKEEQIENLIEHIVEKYGALNMLVNNSGGQFIQESSELRYDFHSCLLWSCAYELMV